MTERSEAARSEAARSAVGCSDEQPDPLRNREILETMALIVAGKVGLDRFGTFEAGRLKKNLETYVRFGITSCRETRHEVVEERCLRAIHAT